MRRGGSRLEVGQAVDVVAREARRDLAVAVPPERRALGLGEHARGGPHHATERRCVERGLHKSRREANETITISATPRYEEEDGSHNNESRACARQRH